LIKQFQSLTHEFRNFRNSIDQNIENIKEFTETSGSNRTKEIRNLIETMELKYVAETDQSQMCTHLETAADSVTDDETDGLDALLRPRAATSHATLGKQTTATKKKASVRIVETLRDRDDLDDEDFIFSVRKAKARCKASGRQLLLNLTLAEKVTNNAKRNV
jgi:hypothetical protein